MNKVILMGRLTKDPFVTFSNNGNNTCIAKYALAVDRRFSSKDNKETDFIPCVVFGKGAEFAGNYLHKGTKILVTGRIETGSYTNDEGRKIYTTNVIVEEQEFVGPKSANKPKTETEDIPMDW